MTTPADHHAVSGLPSGLPGVEPGLGVLHRLPGYARVAFIGLTVLVCAVLASRPGQPPSSEPLSGPAASTARAIDDLTHAGADHDARADFPRDFTAVTHVVPVTVRTSDGLLRTVNPNGGCSTPWGDDNTRWDFGVACKAHDLGYDLLRYAEQKGQPLPPEARRALDARLAADMNARCDANPLGSGRQCHEVARIYAAGADFNSWRQQWGPPSFEPIWAWVAGVAAVAALLAARLSDWRTRRRGGESPAVPGAPVPPALPPVPSVEPQPVAGVDRYLSFLQVIGLGVPVLGESLLTVLHWINVDVRPLWWLPWLLSAAPVFFFSGGHPNLASWRAVHQRSGGFGRYLTGRTSWLLHPVLAFVLAWLVVPLPLELVGVPKPWLEEVGRLIAQPLSFVGVYLVVVAATPPMAWLHRHARPVTPVLLAAAVIGLDLAREVPGVGPMCGKAAVVAVALLLQQCGFLHADGALRRVPRSVYGVVAAMGGFGCAALATGGHLAGPPVAAVVGDAVRTLPMTCTLVLALGQVGLVLALRDPVSAWLRGHRPWHTVTFVRSVPMTLYVGYLTALLAALGVVGVLRAHRGWAEALTALDRPRWTVALALVLVPLLAVFLYCERPRRFSWPAPVESYRGRLAATLGVSYGVLGMLGFVVTGFAGPLGVGKLLVLPVDPLQNLVHLVLGWYLVHTARAGTCGRRLPWALTALACLPALLAPAFSVAGVALHGTTCVLALLAAAARPRPVRPGAAVAAAT